MAEHPIWGRALCRRPQRDYFQRSTNFTGPAPFNHPNGIVPFVLKSLFPLSGTLLERTFAASLAALVSDKCVTGSQLRLALASSKAPAELQRQLQSRVEKLRPAQPARL